MPPDPETVKTATDPTTVGVVGVIAVALMKLVQGLVDRIMGSRGTPAPAPTPSQGFLDACIEMRTESQERHQVLLAKIEALHDKVEAMDRSTAVSLAELGASNRRRD